MASKIYSLYMLVFVFATLRLTVAGDPDILMDFIGPDNSTADPSYFTFTGMRVLVGGYYPNTFQVLKANLDNFPALDGESVSYAVLEFPMGAINPLHIHPRASELLFLVSGTLQVGFVDTTNKLFTQTLNLGDVFVFPKGLVHFQFNSDPSEPALAISAFGSANPGTQSIPNSVFNSSIFEGILEESFNTKRAIIRNIEEGLKA